MLIVTFTLGSTFDVIAWTWQLFLYFQLVFLFMKLT